MARAWTDSEIDLIVADYFAMLREELAGGPVEIARRASDLERMLPRNNSSIRFKFNNISAALTCMGLPRLEAVNPLWHYQRALEDGIQRWIESHPEWLSPNLKPGHATGVRQGEALWIDDAPARRNTPPPLPPEKFMEIATRWDVAARDSNNRALGEAGEQLVLEHEHRTLKSAGREDLARRVRWTSKLDGDGAGYDIHSFDKDGRDRLLEVKTTNGWERTPFHISRNELAVAEARRQHWRLIRVWNFARQPRAFSLSPPLHAHVELTPTSFLASLQ